MKLKKTSCNEREKEQRKEVSAKLDELESRVQRLEVELKIIRREA